VIAVRPMATIPWGSIDPGLHPKPQRVGTSVSRAQSFDEYPLNRRAALSHERKAAGSRVAGHTSMKRITSVQDKPQGMKS
jgi:hypothetical protein